MTRSPRRRAAARRLPVLLPVLLAVLCGCQALVRPLPRTGPQAVYLTWEDDPTTTMTVRWLSRRDDGDAIEIAWSPRDSDAWRTAVGHVRPMADAGRFVNVVPLRGLEPGREYRFRVPGEDREFLFRTMPADASSPIAFVVGGDVYREIFSDRIYRTAAAREPLFAIVGGDIVYDNGIRPRAGRWVHWLNAWTEYMTTPSGRLVPIVPVIGNHEVNGQFDRGPADAPYFYALFDFPESGATRVLDFGGYMSVVVLDSDHTRPIDGAQAEWLDRTLSERTAVPHLFAAYHVPAWPAHRPVNNRRSTRVRTHWLPLFERHGLDVAYEHHDHTYKRTHRIRDGAVHPDGVLYLGDGAWGVPPRAPRIAGYEWYLASTARRNHVFVTTVHGERRWHEAVDPDGVVFDRYPEKAPEAGKGSGSLFPYTTHSVGGRASATR